MALTQPAARKRLHTRRVSYQCFQRDDGLFDIEGRLIDVKDHDYALLSGVRRAGEAVHDLWARITVARDYVIQHVEVKFDAMPYPDGCERSLLLARCVDVGDRGRVDDDVAVRGMCFKDRC